MNNKIFSSNCKQKKHIMAHIKKNALKKDKFSS